MITRIDIRKFGCFSNFDWRSKLRDSGNNVIDLKPINIIYGRNYSGKTTLSRIVRCLETRVLPRGFEDGDFKIQTNSGEITQENLEAPQHVVRVYNKDFVDDNLGFLRDHNGNIRPFAIIGSENNTLETEIENRRSVLGSEMDKSGLKGQQLEKVEKASILWRDATNREKALEVKLTEKANKAPNGIKHNPIYRDVNYNAVKLKKDITTITQDEIVAMTEEQRIPKIALLAESALSDIPEIEQFEPKITLAAVTEILQREVAPQKPIEDLLSNSLLQDWVRSGIGLNQSRKTCGFCGESFKEQFWQDLKAHFDEASEKIAADIDEMVSIISDDKNAIRSIVDANRGKFYSDIQTESEAAYSAVFTQLKLYADSLKSIESALQKRRKDIFNNVVVPKFTDNFQGITDAFTALNAVIKKNNLRTGTLDRDQNNTLQELRLAEVAQFMTDIGYAAELVTIAEKQEEAAVAQIEADDVSAEVARIQSEIDDLQKRLRDEKKGAEKVNDYLKNFFGHDGLRLEAEEVEEGTNFLFKIMRGAGQAFNLSEGECSLVAFCYFIAKLEDIDAAGKELIIYIDDPISSLDNNHIYFVYSLIHSTLFGAATTPLSCKQLFISTHNLEFLKLLKRLPKQKSTEREHLVVSSAHHASTIAPMPKYLRHYVTEFNFLFEQICLCSSASTIPEEHACFYNFGNNMRKFLEVYLFFKYPGGTDPDKDNDTRIKRFFADDGQGVMVQRLTNEYSHLGGAFDRGVTPIDRMEISKVADFVLRRIKEKDPDQFDSLLKSVEFPDPFAPITPTAATVTQLLA